MRTWVVPCRYDPVVHECVASILEHHPDDRVVIVDSCSPDTGYLADFERSCDVLTGNTNYTSGAYGMAVRQFTSNYWCFIQDSLICKQPLDGRLSDLTTLQWFPPDTGECGEFVIAERERMGIREDLAWVGIFGTVLFCSDTIARQIEDTGWYDTTVPTKLEACGTERTLGLVLSHLGLSPFDAIAGQHTDRGSMANDYLRKLFLDRQ